MGMNEIGLQKLRAELELDIERHRWGAPGVVGARTGGASGRASPFPTRFQKHVRE